MPRAPVSCSPKVFLGTDDAPAAWPQLRDWTWHFPELMACSPSLFSSEYQPALSSTLNLSPTMNSYLEFSVSVSLAHHSGWRWRLHMELASVSTPGSWHQWSATTLCHWSQPLKCPNWESFHPLSHPLVKSTSYQMWETLPKALPKAREKKHTVLPSSTHESSH